MCLSVFIVLNFLLKKFRLRIGNVKMSGEFQIKREVKSNNHIPHLSTSHGENDMEKPLH